LVLRLAGKGEGEKKGRKKRGEEKGKKRKRLL